MHLWLIKILILSGLFLLSLVSGLLPVKFVSYARKKVDLSQSQLYKATISLLNCFTAGIFLATCLLHLLPDVQSSLKTAFEDIHEDLKFPLAEFLMTIGFFVVLIVEQFAHAYKEAQVPGQPLEQRVPAGVEQSKRSHDEMNASHKPLLMPTPTINQRSYQNYGSSWPTPVKVPVVVDGGIEEIGGIQSKTLGCQRCGVEYQQSGDSAGSADSQHRQDLLHSGSCENEKEHSDGHGDVAVIPHSSADSLGSSASRRSSSTRRHSSHCQNCKLDLEVSGYPAPVPSFRAAILLLALSLHAIFEGLSLGLQRSEQDTVELFAVLVIHKMMLAFSLGVNLVQSELRLANVIRAVVFFAVTSPCGVGIGVAVLNTVKQTSTSDMVAGILQGLASGTFLYVVFFEILPAEFMDCENRLLKLLVLVLGFAIVTGLLLLPVGDQ